jgi:hypothetical protein
VQDDGAGEVGEDGLGVNGDDGAVADVDDFTARPSIVLPGVERRFEKGRDVRCP